MTRFGKLAPTGSTWNASKSRERYLYNLPKAYRVRLSGTIPKPIHVHNRETAVDVLDAIEGARTLGLDTEFDEDGKIVTWQLSDGKCRVLVVPTATKFFKKTLADKKVRKVFHNVVADLPKFEAAGIEVNGFHADTMILDFLVNENRKRHGLKHCGSEWLNIGMVEYKDYFSVAPLGRKRAVLPPIQTIIETQWSKFLNYATLDAYVTYWLYQHHWAILFRLPSTNGKTLRDYYKEYERQFTVTLSNIMQRGVAIDIDTLNEIGQDLKKTIMRNRHVFVSYSPEVSVERRRKGQKFIEVLAPEEINLESPAQLSALFYDELECKPIQSGRSDDSGRSTNEEHLKRWAASGNILAKCLLDYRRASTIRKTFIGEAGKKGLLAHVVQEMGPWGSYYLVRTSLNQIGAVTARLSSRDPNLQNIPARKEKDPYRMRRAFCARRGCKLIVADYSLFEIRVMAHFSRDKVMLKALRDGRDLHSITAKNCFKLKCSEEAVKHDYPDQRNKGKSINFGLQYGMKAWLLAKQIGVDVDEAQEYIDAYFDLYKGVYRWMKRTVERARVHGYVQTVLGRYRRIEGLDEDVSYGDRKAKARVNHAENQAMNAPIQGSVADIIKIAMNTIETDQYLIDRETRLLLQVHDELVLEAPEIDAFQVRDRVKDIMENAYELLVPTPVDANVGANWEEAKG